MDKRIRWMYVAILKEKKKIQTCLHQLDKENDMCGVYYVTNPDRYGDCFRIELFNLVDPEHYWERAYLDMNQWKRNLVYSPLVRSRHG